MKDKNGRGLGRESVYHSTSLTKSWPTRRDLQSKDCLLEEFYTGQKQALEPYCVQSRTGSYLKGCVLKSKPEKDPKNITH